MAECSNCGREFEKFAQVLARAGRTEEAAAVVERAIAYHEQKGNVVSAARSRERLAELGRASPPASVRSSLGPGTVA